MNLLDRYVAEVGKHLPRRSRADIEAEIHSTLEDMLEERTQGAQASAAQVSDLLKEYGDPRKVAASYGATQYLIGPRLYPTFELVLKIVLSGLGAVLLLSLGFSLVRNGTSGPEISAALGQGVGQLIGGLFTAFGNIVLLFAIIERAVPASQLDRNEKEWDPADLTKDPDPDELKTPELIASIVFPLFFMVILNFYPQVVGFSFEERGQWTTIPVLSPAFFHYLPWINVLILLGVALNVWLLRQGRWQTITRVFGLALRLANIVLFIFMLAGPALLSVTGTALPEGLGKLAPLFGLVPVLALLAALLGEGLKAIKIVSRLLASRPAVPFDVMK